MTSLKSGTQFSFDLLAGALTGRDAARATGALHITGNPGGRIHLRTGGIICAKSPGAPGPDTLLTTGTRGTIGERDLSQVREEVLVHATGRLTTRDIAFALGRSVFPVTVEACRMVADGLFTVIPLSIQKNDDVPLPRSLRRQLLPKLFKQPEKKN